MVLPDSVNVGEYKNKTIYFPDPVIEINIPLNPPDLITLKVKILNYEITLPFHFVPSALGSFLKVYAPNIFEKDSDMIKSDLPEGSFLGIVINCTKTRPHECIWDHVLGKSIPPGKAIPG